MVATATHKLEDFLQSDAMTTLPEIALRVTQIAGAEDPDLQELIEVVRMDPAIAGRLLRFANSAMFGLRNRPASIEAAIPMLGSTLVRTLVLGFSLSQRTKVDVPLRSWARRLWRESLFQASAAECFAETIPGADAPTWFLAGLVQDLGHITMLNVAGLDYVENVLDGDYAVPRVEREKSHFGFTHVDVSLALCEHWGLPKNVTTAIRGHHSFDEVKFNGMESVTPSFELGLMTAAACCEYIEAIDSSPQTSRKLVDDLTICGLNYLPHQVTEILADADYRTREMATAFTMDIGDSGSRENILAKAQRALQKIALETQLRNISSGGVSENTSSTPVEDTCDTESGSDSQYRTDLKVQLPELLSQTHADVVTLAALMVDTKSVDCDVDQNRLLDALKNNVRPTDLIFQQSESCFVVVQVGLNCDMLQKIAARIQSELQEQSGNSKIAVGGTVSVPSGRKVPTPERFVEVLNDTELAARESSDRISLQLLMGKRVVPAK